MIEEKAFKRRISSAISSKVTALFADEPMDTPTIFLCKMKDRVFRRLKLASEMAAEGKQISIIRVDTAETLISKNVRKNDIVIVDRLTTQEFLVNHVLQLIGRKPDIVWTDSRETLSMSSSVDEIRSVLMSSMS